ncbi:thermonuclease family protein [Actinomycetospora chiangmaiensis]|uniref:thermonuclease family protein n=1 Tax=Actinomycetospora chiangmaiensis TaxID=402650 RepID=UPI000365657E|nr:thermonuclease family protein [Actinomycetospora chiangmaiensis]
MGIQHGPSTGAHRAARRGPSRAWLVLAGIVLLAVGVGVGLLVAPRGAEVTATVPTTTVVTSPVAGPTASHPTLLGQVVRVDSGDEVVVRVDGTEMVVAVLGIDAPRSAGPQRATGECGADDALRFADRTLSGQTVTLVPDPTIPEVDDAGRRLAYVVLPSQLSYTDAALLAGVVAADTSRKLWYAPVFAREQGEAVDGDRGLWGAPCRAKPGEPFPAGR